MKILWILGEVPIPADSGGKLRIYGMVKELALRHDITAAVLAPQHDHHGGLAHLNKICKVHVLPWRGRQSSSQVIIGAAANIAAKLPYCVIKYCSDETENSLSKLMTEDFDIIQCENIGFYRFLSTPTKALKILDTHNVEANVWKQRAQLNNVPLLKIYLSSQSRKVRNFEHWLVKQYDAVIAVSDEDAKVLSSEYDLPEISVVPNAIDSERFITTDNTEPGLILFSGAMDYAPNDDAMKFFLNDIWQTISKQHKKVNLLIVGKNPSRSLRSLAGKFNNVEIVGWVPDIVPYLQRSSVVVVPLRMGGGSRLKILEAMAMEKPVVSTTIGAEGISVTSDKNILIADSPSEFAEKTSLLLSDSSLSHRLGKEARKLVTSKYSQSECAKLLEQVWYKLSEKS